MIIDSHSHWLPDEIINNAHFFSKAWGDIESQLKSMDEAGIDKAVLTYPTSDAHANLGSTRKVVSIYNDNVAKIIKRYPDRFIGAAILPIGDPEGMLEEFKRTTEKSGFKAVSLASSFNTIYLDDRMYFPLYEQAAEKNIPIFVHSQIMNPIGYERVKDPLLTPVIEYVFDTTVCVGKMLMSEVFHNFPRTKFIFAYFAGVCCHLFSRFDSTYSMLRGINFVKDLKNSPSSYLKNIFVDTSGDTAKGNFLSALSAVGPGHILWGSDWPAKKDVLAGINAVKELEIDARDKENILGGNLAKLLA